jgi:hypothetical protein
MCCHLSNGNMVAISEGEVIIYKRTETKWDLP